MSDDKKDDKNKSSDDIDLDALNDDEKMAFESIMAEIDGSTEPAEKKAESKAEPEPEPEEKAEEKKEPEENDEEDTENLSDDEMDAFNKIMAEISSGEPEEDGASPDSGGEDDDDEVSLSPEALEAELENVARKASELNSQDTSSDAPESKGEEDLSIEEFNEELKKVLDESETKTSEKKEIVDKEIASLKEKLNESPPKDQPAPPPKETFTDDKNKVEKSKPFTLASQKEEQPDDEPPPKKVKALEEVYEKKVPKKRKGKKRSWTLPKIPIKKIAIALSFVIMLPLAGYALYNIYKEKFSEKIVSSVQLPQETLKDPDNVMEYSPPQDLPMENNDETTPLSESFDEPNILQMVEYQIDEILALIKEKQTEIDELSTYYQKGVKDMEGSIVEDMEQASIPSLEEALSIKRVELNLKTIQRREAYVKKIQTPSTQVSAYLEKLIFFKRKADIYRLMRDKTSGMIIDDFQQEVQIFLRTVKDFDTQLAIDDVSVRPKSIQAIWNRLVVLSKKKEQRKSLLTREERSNQRIWNEICRGKMDRKYELTQLSAAAVNCISEWKGKDLMLNGLTTLPPDIAKVLATWEGNWLGLNSINTLSPESAKYLSRFRGDRLSLNGLSELSPKATAYLSQWKGVQLELIGLKRIGKWENPDVMLYLPDHLQKNMKRTKTTPKK